MNEAVALHVKLLDFSWNQEFKILNGRPFLFFTGVRFSRSHSENSVLSLPPRVEEPLNWAKRR
jgi:hypothetical protein